MYVAGATVDIHSSTMTGNSALGGGPGSASGAGVGGGLFIDNWASVCLDAFTVAQITKNNASWSDPNIHGSYTTCA
jgi:hypothetical protein